MNRSGRTTSVFEGYQLNAIIRGLFWALLVTIILGIIISVLLQYTSLSEGLLGSYSTFIFFISMLSGSAIGAKAAGSKGLLHGLSISLLYWILTLLIGIIWNPEALTLIFLAKRLAFTLGAGVFGGIIGIGLAK